MKSTKHAAVRTQQRAIPPMIVDLLIGYGRAEHAGAGTVRYSFDKESRKRLHRYAGPLAGLLSEHLDCYAVVSGSGELITVAHRFEHLRH